MSGEWARRAVVIAMADRLIAGTLDSDVVCTVQIVTANLDDGSITVHSIHGQGDQVTRSLIPRDQTAAVSAEIESSYGRIAAHVISLDLPDTPEGP